MFLYTAFNIIKSFDIVVLLLTAISLYIIHFYYRYFTRVNPLPGPIPFPFLDILHFLRNDFDDWVFNLNKKYGDIFEINLIGVRQIVLCRAEYIDKMLVPSMDNYMARFPLKDVAKVLGTEGKGLTMNYDLASWKFNRQFFSKSMMTPMFNAAANKWTNELSEEMMGYWTDLGKRSVPGQDVSEEGAVVIDMATWMRRFTNDLISVLTTGKRTHTIPFHYHKLKNEKITKEMLESETFAESLNNFITESPILFVPKILHGMPIVKGKVKRFFDNLDHLYGKLEEKIRERRKEIEESVNKNQVHELRHDMLTSFITANTPYDINLQRNVDPKLLRPMTDDEIRANLLDIFLGGTDTTSNTFCFVLYYISHNPNVKKKMLEEIESVFDGDTSRPVTLEDLEKLKYCEAVIKETSRIRPTVNMFGRRNNNLPDEVAGYKWPVNTQFQIYSRAINNNPLYWEEPDKFNPDRFIDSQVTEKQQKHSFMMFGGGMRVCPGRKIAIIELKALLVLMYRKFDIQLVDMNAPLNVHSKTLAICKELKIKIRPRKKNIA